MGETGEEGEAVGIVFWVDVGVVFCFFVVCFYFVGVFIFLVHGVKRVKRIQRGVEDRTNIYKRAMRVPSMILPFITYKHLHCSTITHIFKHFIC